MHIHVVASGSQDIISQSDGLPPADTHLQQTKKRSHPMHTYKCPTDRKKTQQTKPMTHGSRPSSIAYQVIIRCGKCGSMEEVWRVLVSCFCSIIIYSSAHLPLGNRVNAVVLLQISETSDKVKKICILFVLLLFFEPFLLTV